MQDKDYGAVCMELEQLTEENARLAQAVLMKYSAGERCRGAMQGSDAGERCRGGRCEATM